MGRVPYEQANRAGFTLTETVMTAAIFTGIMGVVLVSLMVSRASYESGGAYVQTQQEVRRAFDVMVKELHQAGQVNNGVTIAAPGVQRLDFQINRSYDVVACGGICWGTDDPTLPSGWLHYVLDASNASNPRMVRCVTANRLDAMPANYAGCRVLANNLSAALANTSFTYDHGNRTVTLSFQSTITSQQLPGGGMSTPLMTRVRLRN